MATKCFGFLDPFPHCLHFSQIYSTKIANFLTTFAFDVLVQFFARINQVPSIRGEKVHYCRISKEIKVLPPEQAGRKRKLLFFHCREGEQLIPWLAPKWPFWGQPWDHLISVSAVKKQKFPFPQFELAYGELF